MITYKCPTCKTPQRGKLPVACLKCRLASEAAEREVAYKEILERLKFLDKLLPQIASITDYLSTNRLGVWGGDSLPCALELIKKHVPLPGATIELPSQPVRKLADRLATAVCGDRQLEGFDVELLSQGHTGSRLSALIVEMAGYEAEAYALQDQVDEANSSVTALEQRIAELEALVQDVEPMVAKKHTSPWFAKRDAALAAK